MNKNTIICSLLIILILHSCKEKDSAIIKNIESYDKQDTLKYYSESGILLKEIPRTNGKMQGWCKWFFPSGELEIEAYLSKDIMTGECIHYYINGSVKYYLLYDLKGNLRFKAEYDSLKKLISYEGKTLYLIKELIRDSGTEKIGVKVCVATPPYSDGVISFMDSKDNTVLKTKVNSKTLLPFFGSDCLNTDTCHIKVIAIIKDTINNITFEDTAYYNHLPVPLPIPQSFLDRGFEYSNE